MRQWNWKAKALKQFEVTNRNIYLPVSSLGGGPRSCRDKKPKCS